MEPSEAEVILEALNQTGSGGAALLKKRLGAVRHETTCLKVELERARVQIAEQQARIETLDRLLKDVYAARSYRMANWLHGSLSALAGLISGRRRAAEREGRCDGGAADPQRGDDKAGPRGTAVLPG